MTPDEWFSCHKKVKYGHLATAENACEEMKQKARNELEPYKCQYGDHWHIGRKRTGKLTQLRLDFGQ